MYQNHLSRGSSSHSVPRILLGHLVSLEDQIDAASSLVINSVLGGRGSGFRAQRREKSGAEKQQLLDSQKQPFQGWCGWVGVALEFALHFPPKPKEDVKSPGRCQTELGLRFGGILNVRYCIQCDYRNVPNIFTTRRSSITWSQSGGLFLPIFTNTQKT